MPPPENVLAALGAGKDRASDVAASLLQSSGVGVARTALESLVICAETCIKVGLVKSSVCLHMRCSTVAFLWSMPASLLSQDKDIKTARDCLRCYFAEARCR